MKKQSPAEPETPTAPKKGRFRENFEALIIAVILALFIRAFVVQAFKIPSGSMKNTLLIGDYILVNKFIFGVKIPRTDITVIPFKKPARGDVIVFKFPNDPSKDFIKRVVAVAGDTVEIRDKMVYVNDEQQQGEYAVHSDPHIYSDPNLYPDNFIKRDNVVPQTIPEGKLFVMGDNRDESNDSRFWGTVDVTAVRGKAFVIYWSWDKDRKDRVRWNRLGDLIH